MQHLLPWPACAVQKPRQSEPHRGKPCPGHLSGEGYHKLAEVSALCSHGSHSQSMGNQNACSCKHYQGNGLPYVLGSIFFVNAMPETPQNHTNSNLYFKQLILSLICKCHPSCHTSQPSGSISCDTWVNPCTVGRE